jgi:hypothetical protein
VLLLDENKKSLSLAGRMNGMHLMWTVLVVSMGLFSVGHAGRIMDHRHVKRDAIEADCGIGNFGGVFSSTSPQRESHS